MVKAPLTNCIFPARPIFLSRQQTNCLRQKHITLCFRIGTELRMQGQGTAAASSRPSWMSFSLLYPSLNVRTHNGVGGHSHLSPGHQLCSRSNLNPAETLSLSPTWNTHPCHHRPPSGLLMGQVHFVGCRAFILSISAQEMVPTKLSLLDHALPGDRSHLTHAYLPACLLMNECVNE